MNSLLLPPDAKPKLELFFEEIRSSGLLQLTAIHPQIKTIITKCFEIKNDMDDAVIFTHEHNLKGFNCHWLVNEIKSPLKTKAKKSDISSILFAHVDIDPESGHQYQSSHESLYNSVDDIQEQYKPSFIIKSGHGIQLFWKHQQPLTTEQGEKINKQLIIKFEGDKGTWNADRLMRVPFTINYPDKRKLSKGYPSEPQWAEVVK